MKITIKSQLKMLDTFQYCYVKTTSNDTTTATGSYVVDDSKGNIIFARTVDMLKNEVLETEHFLGDEYADLKEAFEAHFSLDFIYRDCIVLSFELVRDRDSYEKGTFDSHEKYGEQVYCADLDELNVN